MSNNLERLIESKRVQCPVCKGELGAGNTLACNACGKTFPVLNGIPALSPEPEELIGLWKNRLENFIVGQQRTIEGLTQIAQSPGLYPALGKRLLSVAQARRDNLKTINYLMQPLTGLSPGIPPSDQKDSLGFFRAMVYLFRDWGWDTDEVDVLCNKVIEILPDDLSLESLLVIGAGGCRASYNLHNHYRCPLTISVDLSPLMLLGAKQVISGHELNLYQILANNIRNAHDNVSYWELQSPGQPGNDFLYLLGDATRLSLADSSFQVVLTPFIIDEIGEDLRDFAPRIYSVLQPGGYWVNYGAMTFLPRFNYTAEEVLDIVNASGFRVLEHGFSTQPHAAPHESCLRQVYDCLYFVAIKE